MNYLIPIFITSLGVPSGFFLSRFAKEEIKPGAPYFKILFGIILIGVTCAAFLTVQWWVVGIILVLGIFLMLIFKKVIPFEFAVLGSLVVMCHSNQDVFFVGVVAGFVGCLIKGFMMKTLKASLIGFFLFMIPGFLLIFV